MAPLHESQKYNGAKNARTFAAKWHAKTTGATIPPKHRSELFTMPLREHEATKTREDIADAVIDPSDWPTAKHHFETILAPTTNNIVRDAATVLNLQQQQQPVEDTSKFAVRWSDSLKPLPTAENIETSHWAEQNKCLFVAGLRPAPRELLTQQLEVTTANMTNSESPSWHTLVPVAQNVEGQWVYKRKWRKSALKTEKRNGKGNKARQCSGSNSKSAFLVGDVEARMCAQSARSHQKLSVTHVIVKDTCGRSVDRRRNSEG